MAVHSRLKGARLTIARESSTKRLVLCQQMLGRNQTARQFVSAEFRQSRGLVPTALTERDRLGGKKKTLAVVAWLQAAATTRDVA